MDRSPSLAELGSTPRLEHDVGDSADSRMGVLRVLCFNTRHCGGPFGPFVSERRVADVISAIRPDIAGLNEILQTTRRDQPALLSQLTGAEYLFHGVRPATGGEFGNLLLGRSAPRPLMRIPLSGKWEERGCLLAEVPFGDGLLAVALTHLGLDPRTRRAQIAEIARLLPQDRPLVVLGDFNGRARELEPLSQLVHVPEHSPRTFPSLVPLTALDRVLFSRHFTLRSARAPFSLASDHRPLIVELELKAPDGL